MWPFLVILSVRYDSGATALWIRSRSNTQAYPPGSEANSDANGGVDKSQNGLYPRLGSGLMPATTNTTAVVIPVVMMSSDRPNRSKTIAPIPIKRGHAPSH